MKKTLALFITLLIASAVKGQTKIKDGTVSSPITPNAAAILELESNNKGLLLTRVELTNTTTWGLAGTGTQGMMVYNTSATIGSTDAAYPVITGGKGVYYWDGTGWVATKLEIVEPWKIQGTTSSATANTDNIYQNGKVAIGFTDTDSVTNKQLEVKGEMKASLSGIDTHDDYNSNTIDNALDVTILNGVNEPWTPIYGPTLITTNKEDPNDAEFSRLAYANVNNYHISGSEVSTAQMGARTGDIHHFVRTVAAGNGGNSSGGGVAINSNDYSINKRFSDISVQSNSGIQMNHNTTGGEGALISIGKSEGVRFRFTDSTGVPEGAYIFPRNIGTPNQVLTTTGVEVNGSASLSWQDATTLSQEPFQVESTTTQATTNTQNIYQNGNLGLGNFSAANPLAKLDVRGAIRVGDDPHPDELSGASVIGSNSAAFGAYNKASGNYSAAFGFDNLAAGFFSFVTGSQGNKAFSQGTAILGGYVNRIGVEGDQDSGGGSGIVGGAGNIITGGSNSFIGGGSGNMITRGSSVILGGNTSKLNGDYSLASGWELQSNARNSYVFGRWNAITDGTPDGSFIPTDAHLQVGNGEWGNRKNSLTILQNGKTKIGGYHTTKPNLTLEINGTDGVLLPTGTDAERPSAAVFGTLRYNTTIGRAEVYVNDANGDGTQGDAGWRVI